MAPTTTPTKTTAEIETVTVTFDRTTALALVRVLNQAKRDSIARADRCSGRTAATTNARDAHFTAADVAARCAHLVSEAAFSDEAMS